MTISLPAVFQPTKIPYVLQISFILKENKINFSKDQSKIVGVCYYGLQVKIPLFLFKIIYYT